MRKTEGVVSRISEAVAFGSWTAVGGFMAAIVTAGPDGPPRPNREHESRSFRMFAPGRSLLPEGLLGIRAAFVVHGHGLPRGASADTIPPGPSLALRGHARGSPGAILCELAPQIAWRIHPVIATRWWLVFDDWRVGW